MESGRSVANVSWVSGSTNVYRLGHKGKIDLKYVEDAPGMNYYKDHLPVLGRKYMYIIIHILQRTYTHINRFTLNYKQYLLLVTYLLSVHMGVTLFMRARILLVFSGETAESAPVAQATHCVFKVGDRVRVDLEVEILKAMQEGHGGWNPRMAEVNIYLNKARLLLLK